MNFLNKILLAVFLSLFCFCSIAVVGQAYSADHLILQNLDTQNNLATICQDDGSLCSDVEVVSFDDLDSDQKNQVVEMIASSAMDQSSYGSTLDSDKFSNFLSHSDEISYSSDSFYNHHIRKTGQTIALSSAAVFAPSVVTYYMFETKPLFLRHVTAFSGLATAVGVSMVIFGYAIYFLNLEIVLD